MTTLWGLAYKKTGSYTPSLRLREALGQSLKCITPFHLFFFLSNKKTRAYMFNFPEFTFCLSILIKTKTIDPESSCPCIWYYLNIRNFDAQIVPFYSLSLFLAICKQGRRARLKHSTVLSTEISLIPFKDKCFSLTKNGLFKVAGQSILCTTVQ